jgi:hypothetical protein
MSELQVGQRVRLVNRENLLDRLQFYNDLLFNQQIDLVFAIE